MTPNESYYLTGLGGRLDAGLGEELWRRGFMLAGRETVGAFKKLRFADQVDACLTSDIRLTSIQARPRNPVESTGGHE